MYSQEIKQMVLKRIKNGEKVKSINANTGISIATIYRWVKEEKLESNNIETPFDELSDVELLQKYCNINDLDNALNICLDPKNKNNPIIQSQHINILIKQGKIAEALKICECSEFVNSSSIQSLHIKILIKEGKIAEALKICECLEFVNNPIIQSMRIKILISKGSLMEALAITEQPLFLTDSVIQSQRLSILVRQNRILEALAICESPEFANNPSIQSQHVRILIKQGKIAEALKICKSSEFINSSSIQSQHINILIKQGKIAEAFKICECSEFVNSSSIQSQHIKILINLYRFDDALKICECLEFANNLYIQSQRIEILSNTGNYEMALMICENPLLSGNDVIKKQREKVVSLMQSSSNKQFEELYNTKSSRESSEQVLTGENTLIEENLALKPMDIKISLSLFEAIKKDEILSPSEIDSCEIHDIVKIILIVALYDKQNMSLNVVLRFLKQKIEEYKSISQYLRIIKQLLLRMKSKRIIFDSEYYKALLNSLLRGKIDEKSLCRCKPN